jgi:hypothetical protein
MQLMEHGITGQESAHMDRFSKRYGFNGVPPEITIREDAPEALRVFVLSTLKRYAQPSAARNLVCSTVGKFPDSGNWSVANIWNEVSNEIETCEWIHIYELIEAIHSNLQELQNSHQNSDFSDEEFAAELNDLFVEKGIGWKLEDGRVLARGSESFEAITREAPVALQTAGMDTASNEIHKAIEDLSKRPDPDLTGAVQHGMAALECAGKHICGMTGKQTLDAVVKARPELFRPPLHEAVVKLWGFASTRGRHLQEGGEPTYAEVELVVGTSAIVATYLGRIAIS